MQIVTSPVQTPIQLTKTSLPDNTPVNEHYFTGSLDRKYGSIYIDRYCKQSIMDNYALYVQSYNEHVKKYNATVTVYNETVEQTVKDGIDVVLNSSIMLFCADIWNRPKGTPKSEWILSAYSHEKALKHRPVNVYKYNAAVRKFNEENGPVLPLIKAICLGDMYKPTFQKLIYWYSGKNAHLSLNWNTAGVYGLKMPPMDFNCYNLSKSKRRNGAADSVSCGKTMRNHRIKLEEAGILVNGSFHGTNEARRVYFNPQIMVICDMNQHKIALTENQSVNPKSKKTLPHKRESTLLKYNIKDNETNDSLTLTPLSSFYLNTPMQGAKKIDAPAVPVENLTPAERDSRARLESMSSNMQLAKDLAAGKYDNHQPLNIHELVNEANSGTLSRKQMADYLSQEFLKLTARLWSDKKVFVPVWLTSIRLINNSLYRKNGEYVNKLTMVEHYENHVERLLLTMRFINNHPGFKLLYPSQYFEPHRNKKGSGGYALTEKLLKYRKKDREQTEIALEKSKKAAARREYRKSRNTKMRIITRKYLRNTITYQDLYMEVSRNLAEYKNEIPKWIEDEREIMPVLKTKNVQKTKTR